MSEKSSDQPGTPANGIGRTKPMVLKVGVMGGATGIISREHIPRLPAYLI